MNCGPAGAGGRREARALGLSPRNFGYNSVDLRVCICAPEALCTTSACVYRLGL